MENPSSSAHRGRRDGLPAGEPSRFFAVLCRRSIYPVDMAFVPSDRISESLQVNLNSDFVT